MIKLQMIGIPFILFCVLAANAANGEPSGPPYHPTGLLPPGPQEKAWMEENSTWIVKPAKSADQLPRRAINLEHLPPVGLQIIGSCASWATVYYVKGWQEARKHNVRRPIPEDHLLSPAFVFQFVGVGASQGSSFEDNFDFLERHGTTTFNEFPEHSFLMEGEPPPVDLWKSAAYRRSAAGSLGRIPTDTMDGLLALKERLASGELATTGVGVSRNFDLYPHSTEGVSNEVFFAEGAEDPRGNHALAIIGYDDDKSYFNGTEHRQGAFLAVNSWGTGWGVPAVEGGEAGYIWIAYEYFLNDAGAPELFDFYIMENREDYQPKDFMILDLTHPRRVELGLMFIAGSRDNPVAEHKPLINRGLRPYDARIAVDITDLDAGRAEVFWLRISDFVVPYLPPRTSPYGTIREFTIELDGRQPLAPRKDLPLDTIDLLQQETPSYQWLVAAPLMVEETLFPVDADHSADLADINGDGRIGLANARQIAMMHTGVYTPIGALPGVRWQAATFGDYDNDGLPDLAIFGLFEADWAVRVYNNRGDGNFEERTVFVDPSLYATRGIHWVDYNNDGRLDLLLLNNTESWLLLNLGNGIMRNAGIDLPRPPRWVSHIVDFDNDGLIDIGARRNRGDGTWEDAPWNEDAPIAWGDFDGDGLLDAAVPLYRRVEPGSSDWKHYTHIFRNEGGGQFALVHDDLPGFDSYPPQVMRWVDLNNDGRLDLIISGSFQVVNVSRTVVMLQEEDGTFREFGMPLEGLGWTGPILPGDFNGDGDVDLFWGGLPTDGNAGDPRARRGRIATSIFADPDGVGRVNQPPSIPTGLQNMMAEEPGSVIFSWDDPPDDLTPQSAMRYLLRIGTTPGGCEIVSPAVSLAEPPHRRLSASQAGQRINSLPSGTYHWSVQAIDSAGGYSSWSAEHSFQITNGAPPQSLFNANRDRIVDSADVVAAIRMIQNQESADLLVADIDGNGVIDHRDPTLLAQLLVGMTPDTTPAWMAVVDHRGAVLENGNARVTIPPNAIIGPPAVIRLEHTSSRPFGYNTDEAGPLYQLSGIPFETLLPIEVALANPNYWWDSPKVGLGHEGFAPSANGTIRTYTVTDPAVDDNGVLHFAIPPLGTDDLRVRQSDPDGRYSADFLALGGYSRYTTAHFSIAFHRAYSTEVVESLAADLESAWSLYQSAEFGFSYARRTRWPVDVTLHDMGTSLYGAATASLLGNNHGSLSFNTRFMTDPQVRRVTAFHEFFHIVESLYDPRNRFSKSKFMSPHYTLSEMAATWIEELATSNPSSYVPAEQTTNRFAPFERKGWDLPADSTATEIAAHGYGLSAAIRYLVRRNDKTVVRRAFEEINAGPDWMRALGAASNDFSLSWFHSFNLGYLLGEIYPLSNGDVIGVAAKRMKLSPSMTAQSYDEKLPNLSARIYTVTVQSEHQSMIADEHRLGFRLEGPAGTRLSIVAMPAEGSRELVEIVPWADDVSRTITGSVESVLAQAGAGYVALVTHDKVSPRQADPEPVTLSIALLEDKTVTFPPSTGAAMFQNAPFPGFEFPGGTAMIPAASWVSSQTYEPGIHILTGEIWEDPETELELDFPVVLSKREWDRPELDEVWQVGGINRYTLQINEHDGNRPIIVESFPAPDGKATFPGHFHNGMLSWQLVINYDVTVTDRDTRAVKMTHNLDWPILICLQTAK